MAGGRPLAVPPADIAASEELRLEATALVEEARTNGWQQDALQREEWSEAYCELGLGVVGGTVMQAKAKLEESLRLCDSNHKSRLALFNLAMSMDDYQLAKMEGLRLYNDLCAGKGGCQVGDAVLHLSV